MRGAGGTRASRRGDVAGKGAACVGPEAGGGSPGGAAGPGARREPGGPELGRSSRRGPTAALGFWPEARVLGFKTQSDPQLSRQGAQAGTTCRKFQNPVPLGMARLMSQFQERDPGTPEGWGPWDSRVEATLRARDPVPRGPHSQAWGGRPVLTARPAPRVSEPLK